MAGHERRSACSWQTAPRLLSGPAFQSVKPGTAPPQAVNCQAAPPAACPPGMPPPQPPAPKGRWPRPGPAPGCVRPAPHGFEDGCRPETVAQRRHLGRAHLGLGLAGRQRRVHPVPHQGPGAPHLLPGQRRAIMRAVRPDALAVNVGGKGRIAQLGQPLARRRSSSVIPFHWCTTTTPGRGPDTGSFRVRIPSSTAPP